MFSENIFSVKFSFIIINFFVAFQKKFSYYTYKWVCIFLLKGFFF